VVSWQAKGEKETDSGNAMKERAWAVEKVMVCTIDRKATGAQTLTQTQTRAQAQAMRTM
jgi:hypothetical protein